RADRAETLGRGRRPHGPRRSPPTSGPACLAARASATRERPLTPAVLPGHRSRSGLLLNGLAQGRPAEFHRLFPLFRDRNLAVDRVGVVDRPGVERPAVPAEDREADPLVDDLQVVDLDRLLVIEPLAGRELRPLPLDLQDVAVGFA